MGLMIYLFEDKFIKKLLILLCSNLPSLRPDYSDDIICITTRYEFLNAMEKFDLQAFLTYRDNAIKQHKLRYIFWECTLQCNMACRHCGSECVASSNMSEMPYADFLKAIDEILCELDPGRTTIAIIGGEPLLRNDIEDLGYELQSRGLFYGMVTNGFLLSRKRLNSLWRSGLRSMSVSLDGLEENHNWLRMHPGSFKQAVKAIEMVVQNEGVNFDVITCVHKRNFNELPNIRNLLIKLGVKAWRLFTIFPRGRAALDDELILERHQVRQLFDFIINTKQQGNIRADYGCEGYAGSYERKIRDYPFFCISGVQVASVLADGSISGCPSTRQDFIEGNIYKDNFRDCWNERFHAYRNRKWMQTDACNKCKDLLYCNGGSMHLRTSKNELFYCHHMAL